MASNESMPPWMNNAFVGTQELAPAETLEEYLLHLAALEWSLADPIIIERSEDIKSRVNWQDRLEPYAHQIQNLITFCRRLPVTLIADDVGLGKTISAGLILSELMVRRRVSRTLIVCPLVLGPQWIDELESKFGVFGRLATGNELDEELRRDSPVVVTTYQSISPRLQQIQPGQFDMVIFDEAHKVRNLHGVPNPPMMAKRIRVALQQRLFKYVLMLTATPIQNRLWDLYSLIDCLTIAKGHANPLGDPYSFARNFISDGATARVLNPAKATEFRRILRQYLVRTRRQEVRLLFPSRIVRLFRVGPNSVDRRSLEIVAQNIQGLHGFMQISLLRALMSSPQALIAQLRNMSDPGRDWSGVAQQVESIIRNSKEGPSKLQGLFKIIDELRSQRGDTWRLVIFTIRRETLRIIGEALTERGIKFGEIKGGSAASNQATIKAFVSNPPQVNVVVSTDAGAEGVNLQAGNVLVNFDLPWNPMVVEQRIGRIQRLAANHKEVYVFNLAVRESPEEWVVARLMEKLQTIVDSVGDIEAILEATASDDDRGEGTFEGQLLHLVLRSMEGQDVQKAMQLAERSIQEAKALFEQHQTEMDTTLGGLGELHQAGPSLPHLTQVRPSVGHEDFVHRALTAEGFDLSPSDNGMLRARKHDSPTELITFDENEWRENIQAGVFMGRAPKLYLPGKPDFERLVQRWLSRGGHSVSDLRPQTSERAKRMFQSWLCRIDGAQLTEVKLLDRKPQFQGKSRCKMTASNAVDSYEKLLDVGQIPTDHANIFESAGTGSTLLESIDPKDVAPTIPEHIRRVTGDDHDVNEFCEFYTARLNEEYTKAGSDKGLREKVSRDLRPAVHVQAVALHGVLYESGRFSVRFSIDGKDVYSLEFDACPVTGQLFSEPSTWEKCAETKRLVPRQCLSPCDVSHQRVLTHLLVKSDESGRWALEKYAVKCEVSGRLAFTDEFGHSDVSGRKVAASLLIKSSISGRKGLRDEFESCDFTKMRVLVDELVQSEISGRKYRKDQRGVSAVSHRSGHWSEFVNCQLTGAQVLADETIRSDVSGRLIRRDRIIVSSLPPFRRGATDESVVCARSGKTLLRDEAETCAATGKVFAKTLLVPSEETGKLALPETLETCSVTGKRVLPSELVSSCVSGKKFVKSVSQVSPVSGQVALPDECVACEFTKSLVLPSELTKSDVSERKFRSDEAVKSAVTERVGHRSESTSCDFTKRILLDDEAGKSDLSGQKTFVGDLIKSQKSDRLGHETEFETCAITQKRLLTDETAKSSVSGLVVDKDLLVASDRSRLLALKDEMVKCSISGATLLPSETEKCAVTGEVVDRRALLQCDISGQWARPDKMIICPVTGKRGIPGQFVECALSNALIAPSAAARCSVTGKQARKDQLLSSAVSRRLMMPNVAVRSSIGGDFMCPDEAVFCNWTEGYLLPRQTTTCKRTGLSFQKELVGPDGQFTLLSELLEFKLQMFEPTKLVKWLRKQRGGIFSQTKKAWIVQSPKKGIWLVCAQMHDFWGNNLRYAGLLLRARPPMDVLGDVTVNAPNQAGWAKL